jgi:hypothetical protein
MGENDKARFSQSESGTTKIPKHLQIIKTKIKTKFQRKTENNLEKNHFEQNSIIRERGQSVTAECCSLGARSVRIFDQNCENRVTFVCGQKKSSLISKLKKK